MSEGITCTACSKELRADARFCDGCGTPVAAPAPAPVTTDTSDAELRTVTVLFADLKGYTALSAELDPDEVHEILQRVFAVTDSGIVAHRGHVEKHIGDAVMALFGVPRAYEDDPERAVRAALRIQHRITELSERLVDEGLPRVSLRIGINTGRVVVGSVGDRAAGETSVFGDTVNVASRLEEVCPPGEVLVSESTWARVRDRFEGDPQTPVRVKGKRDALRTVVVRSERTVDRGDTSEVLGRVPALVGRDAPLAALAERWAATTPASHLTAVHLTGPGGVGKRRVVDAFVTGLDSGTARVVRLRGRVERSETPFGVLGELVRFAIGAQSGEPGETLARRVGRWLASPSDFGLLSTPPIDTGSPEGDIVARLLGFTSEGDVDRARGSRLINDAFIASVRENPTIVLLDALQWIDAPSLEALGDLAELAPDLPLMLIATTRPDPGPVSEAFLEKTGSQAIAISPLEAEEAQALVRGFVDHVEGVPEDLILSLAERSGGIAYFAEELVKRLADDDVFFRDPDGTWRCRPDRLSDEGLPATVEGLLQSRLDALPPNAGSLVRLAAVVGSTFGTSTLVALLENGEVRSNLAGAPDPTAVSEAIELLIAREFLRPADADRDASRLRFVHEPLREVTYQSLTKRSRRGLHSAVADCLAPLAEAPDSDVGPAAVGWHLEVAGRLKDASEWLAKAAAAGRLVGAYREALGQMDRALSLLSKAHAAEGPEAMALFQSRGSLHASMGRIAEGREDAQRSLQLAERHQDLRTQVEAHVQLSFCGYLEGNPEATLSHAERAAGLADKIDDVGLEARIQNALGIAWGSRGYFTRAIEYYSRAAELAEEAGNRRRLASCLGNIGINTARLGRFALALAYYNRSLKINAELGNRHGECVTLDNLAFVHLRLGDTDSAVTCFERAQSLARELDLRGVLAEILYGLGRTRLAEGILDEALRLGKAALEDASAGGFKVHMGQALRLMGQISERSAELEGVDRPEVSYERSIELLRSTGERDELAESLWALGEYLQSRGQSRRADRILGEAKELFVDLQMGWRIEDAA